MTHQESPSPGAPVATRRKAKSKVHWWRWLVLLGVIALLVLLRRPLAFWIAREVAERRFDLAVEIERAELTGWSKLELFGLQAIATGDDVPLRAFEARELTLEIDTDRILSEGVGALRLVRSRGTRLELDLSRTRARAPRA